MIGRRAFRGCARIVVLLLVALIAFAVYQGVTWPDVEKLVRSNPRTTAFIERYRHELRDRGLPDAVDWRWVSYTQISAHLKRAVLVGEDIDFFTHGAVDTREVLEALDQAWKRRELPRGASTITQQLAKNLWLSPSFNPLRKLRELVLARQLERHLGKKRILELYLNVAEFGPGVYGAEAAARHYFGKAAAELTPEEAAELAASLPRPSSWHPGSTSRAYQRYVRAIQNRMARADFLWRQI